MNFKIKISFCCIALMSVLLIGCKEEKKENYTFKGEIEGAADGTKVLLKAVDEDLQAAVLSPGNIADSTQIKDGKFEFSGKLPEAKLYLLVIASKTNAEETGMPVYQPSVPVFLENSDIGLEAKLDSIPSADVFLSGGKFSYKNITVTGSVSQDIYFNYREGIERFEEKASALFNSEYLPYLNAVKGSAKESVSKGVAIVTKIEDNQEKRHAYVFQFIKKNIDNMVGLTLAKQEMDKFSLQELEKLSFDIPAAQKNTAAGKKIIAQITNAKSVASGAAFIDLPFEDPEGKAVKLSDHVGKGNFVLLEFWASWCHPCRASIPHLKEVYELYHPQGFEIISVSMDQDKQTWLGAVKEEKMPWLQVSDLQAFNGDLAKKYQLSAIPTCILLDPKGKIVTREMRDFFMDKKLIDLYGNQFGKKF